MAYESPHIRRVRGRTIEIDHLSLPESIKTMLTATASAGATSLTVLDNAGFSQNQLALIGSFGTEQTEIKQITAAVSAGTSLTVSATTYAHGTGTEVRRVLFNQWQIHGNSTNSTTGTTTIATIDMQVGASFTSYVNTGTEYSFYFVRPYDSVNAVTGDFSDGVSNTQSTGGYAENSVGGLILAALSATKKKMGGNVQPVFFYNEINDCLRYVAGKLKRWTMLQSFDYALGQTIQGEYLYSLPSDMDDRNSLKSILGVHIDGAALTPKDKREFEDDMNETKHTQVRTEAAVGATTLEIDNSYDFDDSGTVDVYVSGTKYSITYTGVTRSATAGVLTGVPASGTGSITVTTPVDSEVWQDQTEGLPTKFTVYDGNLYIWPLPDSTIDNMNVWLDYYTSRTAVNSDGDTIEFPRYDMVKHWLIWKLRSLDNESGKLDPADGDFIMFNAILTDMIRREVNSQKHKMKPNYNQISYGSTR